MFGATVALAWILSAGAVAGEPVAPADFLTDHIRADLPHGAAHGQLAVFRTRETDAATAAAVPTPAAELPDSDFSIVADRIDVQTDSADAFVAANAVSGPVPGPTAFTPSPTVHSTSSSYSHVTMNGTTARDGQFLYGFPLEAGDVVVHLSCASASPSPEASGTVHAPAMITPGSAMDADVSKAVKVDPCDGSHLEICGSFRVAAWERDGTITADEGNFNFWSGKRDIDGAPSTRPVLSKAQEVLVNVLSGCLTMSGAAAVFPSIYLNSLDLDQASAIRLDNATGQVPSVGQLTGHTVALTGELAASIQKSPEGLVVKVANGIRSVDVDGQVVAFQSTIATPVHHAWVPWLAIGAAVVLAVPPVVAVPVRTVRIRRARLLDRIVYQAEVQFMRSKFDEAQSRVEHVLERDANHGEALALLARLRDQSGDWEGADNAWARAERMFRQRGDLARCAELGVEAGEAAARAQAERKALAWLKGVQQDSSAHRDATCQPHTEPLLSRLEEVSLVPSWLRA